MEKGKLIAHQAVGVHLPLGLAASLAQRPQELLPIRVVPEDGLSLIPAIHYVVNRPGYWMRSLRDTPPP